MPAIVLPLTGELADPDPTGPIRRFYRARLDVEVQTEPGSFTLVRRMVIDTGASYTTMSATLARSRGIPFPPETSRLGMITTAGPRAGRVHDGELRVRFPRLPDHLFRLYCVFAENIPPSVPPVFGLNDFLDVFQVMFSGRSTPDAPFGVMRFETWA